MSGWHRWLWVSVAVIAVDLATKVWFVTHFRDGEVLPVTSFFSFILTYNTGVAFSVGAGDQGWQRWVFAGIALAASMFLLWMLRRGGSRALMLGLALILGGALGNLWDRLLDGRVTDFVLVYIFGWPFPAFNVADSAITVGAALLIFDSFRAQPRKEAHVGRESR